MRPDERTLTPEEQAALDAIEATPARPSAGTGDTATVAGIATLVRRATPQADPAFREALRARLLSNRAAPHPGAPASMPPPPRGRVSARFTRRRALAAGLAAAGLGAAALAAPQARAAVAALLGRQTPPPAPLPIAVERATPLPIAITNGKLDWAGPGAAQREYLQRTIMHVRGVGPAPFPRPDVPAGSIVALPNGRGLPIPGYLPSDFRWLGIALSNMALPLNTLPFEYIGQGTSGGGGSGLPWERPLHYDRDIAAYLIGGDPAERLLLLQQLKPDAGRAVAIGVFQMAVPPETPPAQAPPGFYDARTVLGIFIEPAREQYGLAIQVGPNTLHQTAVGGAVAWWFGGAWDPTGHWVDDGTWVSVAWARDGYIYCLSGQEVGLDALLRVAESLP